MTAAAAGNVFDRFQDTHAVLQPHIECTEGPLDQACPDEPAALALEGKAYVQ